jgi:hypothetical protein
LLSTSVTSGDTITVAIGLGNPAHHASRLITFADRLI